MSECRRADPRANTWTAARVEDALRILQTDGTWAAFVFMQLAGVPRHVAMRLLCCHEKSPPIGGLFSIASAAHAICMVRTVDRGVIRSRRYFRLFRLLDQSSAQTIRAGFQRGS